VRGVERLAQRLSRLGGAPARLVRQANALLLPLIEQAHRKAARLMAVPCASVAATTRPRLRTPSHCAAHARSGFAQSGAAALPACEFDRQSTRSAPRAPSSARGDDALASRRRVGGWGWFADVEPDCAQSSGVLSESGAD